MRAHNRVAFGPRRRHHRAITWILPVLFSIVSVSCGSSSMEGCGPVGLSEAAAADCVEVLEFEGHRYTPWCSIVRPELIGQLVATGSNRGWFHYEARSIQGAPNASALAIASILEANGRVDARGCGGWKFSPASDLSSEAASALARRVTVENEPARD